VLNREFHVSPRRLGAFYARSFLATQRELVDKIVDTLGGLQSAILLPLSVILQPDESVTPPRTLIRT
jgi:hypothetical protein